MLKKHVIWAAVFLFLNSFAGGCRTNPSASLSADYALTSIYSATEKAMSMGVLRYSENHREFYSRPFMVKQKEVAKKKNLHERGLAKVTVLGDQRPYSVQVEIRIERAVVPGDKVSDGDYSFDRFDNRLASKLLNNIISILNRQERDKNIIDDFRPF